MKELIRQWWHYLRHREQYTWAWRTLQKPTVYGPYIVIGESAGLYTCNDEDTYCRWCGNNITEGHHPQCDYLELCEVFGWKVIEWSPPTEDKFWLAP